MKRFIEIIKKIISVVLGFVAVIFFALTISFIKDKDGTFIVTLILCALPTYLSFKVWPKKAKENITEDANKDNIKKAEPELKDKTTKKKDEHGSKESKANSQNLKSEGSEIKNIDDKENKKSIDKNKGIGILDKLKQWRKKKERKEKKARKEKFNKPTQPTKPTRKNDVKILEADNNPEDYDIVYGIDVYSWLPEHVKNLRKWLQDNNRVWWNPYTDEEILQEKRTRPLFEFKFTRTLDVALKPEPDNEYDPNAILVLLAGKEIGYIPREDTSKIRNAKIGYLELELKGGRLKRYDPKFNYVRTIDNQMRPTLNIGVKLD